MVPSAAAWFEHRLLADRAGLLLVTANDLDILDHRVRHRASGEVIDALYLRLDDELIDVVDRADRPIGAEVFDLAEAGDVVPANAPGHGGANDQGLDCYGAGRCRV